MDRRRYRRYAIQLPVELQIGRTTLQALTSDVSFQGLFLCLEQPPALRRLVRLAVELPTCGTTFRSHAMCVFRVEPGNHAGLPPGAGFKLYATAQDERERWHAFVDRLRVLAAERVAPVATPDPPPELELDLEVVERRPGSVDDLLQLLEKELSQGIVNVGSDHAVAVGTPLCAHLVHPETGGIFSLEGVVRRSEPEHGGTRLLVEWSDPSGSRLEEFRRFVYLGFTDVELEDVASLASDAAP